MDLSTGLARLAKGLKALRLRWAQTSESWNDAAAREFEERHLQDIDDRTVACLREMDKLNQVLRQAEAECRGP